MTEDSVCMACGYSDAICECSDEDLLRFFHALVKTFGLKIERRAKMNGNKLCEETLRIIRAVMEVLADRDGYKINCVTEYHDKQYLPSCIDVRVAIDLRRKEADDAKNT